MILERNIEVKGIASIPKADANEGASPCGQKKGSQQSCWWWKTPNPPDWIRTLPYTASICSHQWSCLGQLVSIQQELLLTSSPACGSVLQPVCWMLQTSRHNTFLYATWLLTCQQSQIKADSCPKTNITWMGCGTSSICRPGMQTTLKWTLFSIRVARCAYCMTKLQMFESLHTEEAVYSPWSLNLHFTK